MNLKIYTFCIGEMAIPVRAIFNNLGNKIPEGIKINGINDIKWSDNKIDKGIKHPGCVYYIEGGRKKILVDTGIVNFDFIRKIRDERGDRYYLKEKKEWDLKLQLDSIGITTDDIDIIINTHLHWDHIGGNSLFRNAKFYIQKEDVYWALLGSKSTPHFFKQNRSNIINILDKVEIIDGDVKIDEGIRLAKVGGHTPGSQIVLVDTKIGTVALTGDVIPKYENWEYNWPGPAGNIWNLSELINAYSIIKKYSDIIIPGHDWEVWKRYKNGIIG